MFRCHFERCCGILVCRAIFVWRHKEEDSSDVLGKNIHTVTHSRLSRSLYTINYFCSLLGRVVETLLHVNLRHMLCIQSQHCFCSLSVLLMLS